MVAPLARLTDGIVSRPPESRPDLDQSVLPMRWLPAAWQRDAALLREALSGDSRAARALVKRLLPQAHAMAWRLTGNPQEADDVVQEAFCRLWEHGARVEPRASLGTYFNTIVIRLCHDRFRRSGREVVLDDDAMPAGDADTHDDPAARYLARADGARLQALLAALPARQRMAVVMWAYHDSSAAEIAAALDIDANAAHQLLHRGRQNLKRMLKEQDDA